MERKIGEIFEYNGEWYQCLKGISCKECDFSSNSITCDIHGAITCARKGRSDNTSVVFKKLEKVGEPYYNYEKKLCQQYKCYINPLVTDEIVYVFADNKVVIEIKQNKEDMEEKNEVKGANVLSKEEWCIIEKAQEDWKRIFPDIPLMSSMSVDAFFPHIIKLGLLDKYKEHSNSEKIGKNLKPFDIEAAKAGKPVCTRDGRKARIICFDAINEDKCPIIALARNGQNDYAFYCDNEGKSKLSKDLDLMMLPEKKEGWVNLYKSSVRSTKEEAMKYRNKCNDYIDTIKIEWEE